jgi:hypothetical protein
MYLQKTTLPDQILDQRQAPEFLSEKDRESNPTDSIKIEQDRTDSIRIEQEPTDSIKTEQDWTDSIKIENQLRRRRRQLNQRQGNSFFSWNNIFYYWN